MPANSNGIKKNRGISSLNLGFAVKPSAKKDEIFAQKESNDSNLRLDNSQRINDECRQS